MNSSRHCCELFVQRIVWVLHPFFSQQLFELRKTESGIFLLQLWQSESAGSLFKNIAFEGHKFFYDKRGRYQIETWKIMV